MCSSDLIGKRLAENDFGQAIGGLHGRGLAAGVSDALRLELCGGPTPERLKSLHDHRADEAAERAGRIHLFRGAHWRSQHEE